MFHINAPYSRWLTFATLLTLLPACSVGPDYVRPAVEVPLSFKEIQGWKPAQPGDGDLKAKWRELFNDNKLNALEEQDVISNQNIALAEAQFRRALPHARKDQLPQVWWGIAVSLYYQGKIDAAVTAIDRVIALRPGDGAPKRLRETFLDAKKKK